MIIIALKIAFPNNDFFFLRNSSDNPNDHPSFPTVSVPPPDGDVEEERDRTETRGPLPPPPQITDHQARAALLAHVADRCCWGSGAAKKMAIAKINYDSAFHVSTRPLVWKPRSCSRKPRSCSRSPRLYLTLLSPSSEGLGVMQCAYSSHGSYLAQVFLGY